MNNTMKPTQSWLKFVGFIIAMLLTPIFFAVHLIVWFITLGHVNFMVEAIDFMWDYVNRTRSNVP